MKKEHWKGEKTVSKGKQCDARGQRIYHTDCVKNEDDEFLIAPKLVNDQISMVKENLIQKLENGKTFKNK